MATLLIISLIILFAIVLFLIVIYKLNKKSFGFSNSVTLSGIPNATGNASITRTEKGHLLVNVQAYMPVDIVGTPAYQAWLINKLTGNKVSLGRLERLREGEYFLRAERNSGDFDGYNDIAISEADNLEILSS